MVKKATRANIVQFFKTIENGDFVNCLTLMKKHDLTPETTHPVTQYTAAGWTVLQAKSGILQVCVIACQCV